MRSILLLALFFMSSGLVRAAQTFGLDSLTIDSDYYGKQIRACKTVVTWAGPIPQCWTVNSPAYWVNSTSRPSGTTTQWLTYKFRVEGDYLLVNDGRSAHIATVMRLKPYYLSTNNLSGAGLAAGYFYATDNGCGKPGTATEWMGETPRFVVETWQFDANDPVEGGDWLDPDTCSNFSFQLNKTYGVAIHASDSGWISYEVFDDDTHQSLYLGVAYDFFVQFGYADRSTGEGFMIAPVDGHVGYTSGYSSRVKLWEISGGWF